LRIGIEQLITEVESHLLKRSEGLLIHVFLPTGYGKSEASFQIAELIAKEYSEDIGVPVERLIHVVPTKYLVEDLLQRARARGLPALAQSMFMNPSFKAPYFIQPLIFTTFDSYTMNYYRVPIAEIRSIASGKSLGHTEVPRYSILTAINIFDEYHMFVPGDSPSRDRKFESKAWTCLHEIIKELLRVGVPVLLETATPREDALRQMKKRFLKETIRFIEIEYDYAGRKENQRIIINDQAFAIPSLEKKIKTDVVGECSLESITTDELLEEDFTLIVTNTIKESVRVFRAVKTKAERCFILHSRLMLDDRLKRLRKIREVLERRKPITLVSTQVIEVGVNLDFRVLITSAAPISSLVQRIGRIGRGVYLDEQEFIVKIAYNHSRISSGLYDGVYSGELVRRTVEGIRSIRARGKEISWKIPSSDEIDFNGMKLVPYNRLAYEIYSACELGYDNDLARLLQYFNVPYLRSKNILEYIIKLGGLIRDSVILPVYVPEERERVKNGEGLEFRPERLVPVKAENLGIFLRGSRIEIDIKYASKVLLSSDGKIMTILSNPRDEIWYELVPKEVLAKLLSRMHAYLGNRLVSLESLVAKPESYDQEVGLVVDL